MAFIDISKHMENMQFSFKEHEKINAIMDTNGRARIDIDQMLDRTQKFAEERFDDIHKKIGNLRISLENAQEKMYDHKTNMKNNLIFYGITQEGRENSHNFQAKVLELIHVKFNIKRMYSGPEVHGCRPVLVTFQDFNEKEEVL